MKFIFDENHKVIEADLITWNKFLGDKKNIVAVDKITLSTIFVGSNNILFETMIIGGKRNGETWQWKSWEEAIQGHNQIINKLKE